MQDERKGMPTMAGHLGGSGVIPRHHKNIGLQSQDLRKVTVDLFNDGDFGVKIAILPPGIRLFNVDEKEVIMVELILQGLKLFSRVETLPQTVIPTSRAIPRYIG